MADANNEGHIVEDYKIGNTKIRICNAAYKNRTPEEIEKILRRVASIGWDIVESTNN